MFIKLRESRWWKVALVVVAVGLVAAPVAQAHHHHTVAVAGHSLAAPPTIVASGVQTSPSLDLQQEWREWHLAYWACRTIADGPVLCFDIPDGWSTVPYGQNIQEPGAIPLQSGALVGHTARAQKHKRRCRWRLTVTGGQKPGSPIVLHLWNTCDGPWWRGPQITKHLPPLPAKI